MPLVPIAAFLAGALLSLLLPTLLLIALAVWYLRFVRRAPGPAGASEPAMPASDSDVSPGPSVASIPDTAGTSTPGAEATRQS